MTQFWISSVGTLYLYASGSSEIFGESSYVVGGPGQPANGQIKANTTFKYVCAYDDHVLALDVEGVVYSWGKSLVGINQTTAQKTPITIGGTGQPANGELQANTTIAMIRCGPTAGFLIDNNGVLYGWGQALTIGKKTDQNTPVIVAGHGSAFGEIPANVQIQDIDCSDHCIALASDNSIYGWGKANAGLCLGNTIGQDVTSPKKIGGPNSPANNELTAGKKIVRFSVSLFHTLLLDEHGVLYVCGTSNYGATGLGKTATQYNPVILVGPGFTVSRGSMQAGTKIIDIQAAALQNGVGFGYAKDYTGTLHFFGTHGDTYSTTSTPVTVGYYAPQSSQIVSIEPWSIINILVLTSDDKMYYRRFNPITGNPVAVSADALIPFSYSCYGEVHVEYACNAHGTCIYFDQCNCTSSQYGGPVCGTSICNDILATDSSVCSGHGSCEDGICTCSDTYTGTNCDTKVQCLNLDFNSPSVCSCM
jgi:hypothetical protein